MSDIREFMTDWMPGNMSSMLYWSERQKSNLRGVATGKRKPPDLRPFDLIRAPHEPVGLLANADMRVSVDSAAGPAPFFIRTIDFDTVIFQFAGTARIECEMSVEEMAPGDMIVIPRGIAYRSVGDKDALRMIVHLKSPVTHVMDESECTSRTQWTLKRIGGPDYSEAAAKAAPTGPVIEKMLVWDEDPADAVTVRRVAEELIGVSSRKRDEKENAIRRLRPFDLFKDITGRKGPGPKLLASDLGMFEVYNTHGEQFAFHRALESEEFGLQFNGVNTNMSEFEEGRTMSPGDWFLIPLGIAHSVKDCGPDFRRMVIYSKLPFKVLADEKMHVHQSRFEVTENVVEPAAWHAELKKELAGAPA